GFVPGPPGTGTPTPTPTPTTTPSPGNDPVFVGAGDISSCTTSGDEATATLLDGIAGTVYTLGDNTYPNGASSEFTGCYDPTWGRHKARTKPANGNHDYTTAGAPGYYGYFGDVATGNPPGCTSACKGYYSYDLGTWHIIVLNTECAQAGVGGCEAGSPQEQWLRADLAADQSSNVLAYWHKPRFSVGGSNSFTQPFWQALYDYGADLVLGGHVHDYERFAPQNPAGQLDLSYGIREFIVGTGGYSHFGGASIANPVAQNQANFGLLKLTLQPSRQHCTEHPATPSPTATATPTPTPTGTVFIERNIAGDCVPGGGGTIGDKLLQTTSAPAGISATIARQASDVVAFAFTTDPGQINPSDWGTGTYTVELNVTAAGGRVSGMRAQHVADHV